MTKLLFLKDKGQKKIATFKVRGKNVNFFCYEAEITTFKYLRGKKYV